MINSGTYVKLTEEREGWESEELYKVCYISVRNLGLQVNDPDYIPYDENDYTIDAEDMEYMDDIEDNAAEQEVVETLLLLGNHKTGSMEWFHTSEVKFVS